MMRLVFSDLRDHAATWIGAFLVPTLAALRKEPATVLAMGE